jgi:hypothetical protein
MAKRAEDMTYIKDLAASAGIPFELLYRMTNAQPGAVAAAPSTEPTTNNP